MRNEVDEARTRLAMVNAYHSLSEAAIFGLEDSELDDAALAVQNEVKQFALDRMMGLMGGAKLQVPSVPQYEEIELPPPRSIVAPRAPARPLSPARPQPIAARPARPVAPPPPAAPAIPARRKPGALATPAQATRPSPKPAPQPAEQPEQDPEPAADESPAAETVMAFPAGARVLKGGIDESGLIQDGTIIEVGDNRWSYRWVQMAADTVSDEVRQIMIGEAKMFDSFNTVLRAASDVYWRIVRREMRQNSYSLGGRPPTLQDMSSVMFTQANQAVNLSPKDLGQAHDMRPGIAEGTGFMSQFS